MATSKGKTEAKTKSAAKTKTEAKTKTTAKPKTAAKTKAEAKPKPKPKPEAKPKAKPKTAAKTKPKAEAKPKSVGPAKGGNLGTRERPWVLTTPSGGSEFEAFRDETLDPPALVVRVGKTELRYHLRCLTDLHEMLKEHGDWMPLGGADEQKPAAEGTVEAWARSSDNPVGGWYGLKKGLRGRFGVYVPPVMKVLKLAEVENQPKNNRMRAL